MSWMANGSYREAPVNNIAAPAERTKTYAEYRPMFVAPAIIRNGVDFYERNIDWLEKAEQEHGVPGVIVTAIIGIETKYGRSTGRHRTFDSLGSLAVTEGRRADYFQREWAKFILINYQRGVDPLSVKGSYAGATGIPQFMPSSYEAYAVDHNQDGDIDIWTSHADAIGSVANYLDDNGWRTGELIASAAAVSGDFESIKINDFDRDRTVQQAVDAGWQAEQLAPLDDLAFPIILQGQDGAEYWLGYRNFWVISRYNRSISYAMAVVELANEISLAIAE